MRRICLAVCAIVTLAMTGATQHHDDKYIVCGATLGLVDGTTGTLTTIYDNAGTAYDAVMDVDNRSLWFIESGGIMKVDVITNAVTTILPTAGLTSPYDLALNQDADLVIADGNSILKLTGAGLSTIATAPTAAGSLAGGLEIDIDTGHYVVQSKSSPNALFAIDDAGTITTLGTGGSPRWSIAQDIITGDWYQGSFSALYKLQKPTSTFVATTLSGGAAYFYAFASDRASDANRRFVSIHNNGSTTSRFNYIDVTTHAVTLTTLNHAIYNYETEIYRSRDFCSVKTAPGKWTLLLNLPTKAGQSYVMALSLTGVRPATLLPDGRRIPLAIDPLTVLTLNNQIPTIFQPGSGVLGATGTGIGSLDVSSLPPLPGIRVWAAAVVLGTSSVDTIVDPIGINL